MSGYLLGTESWRELRRGHPKLIAVTGLAITLTDTDFGVHDVLRTLAEQEQEVAEGTSWTLDSMHRARDPETMELVDDEDPVGVACAVDLVPYVRGRLRWEWPPCYKVAAAVRRAADQLKVELVWGGVWDRPLLQLGDDLEKEVAAYVARRQAAGKRASIDGPHFQLI